MPTEAIFYVADKLLGGVVSYLVRSGADAVLNRINKQLEESHSLLRRKVVKLTLLVIGLAGHVAREKSIMDRISD